MLSRYRKWKTNVSRTPSRSPLSNTEKVQKGLVRLSGHVQVPEDLKTLYNLEKFWKQGAL